MSFFKDYFTYSKKERSGIVALFVLMLLSIFTYFSIDYFYFKNEKYDYSSYKKEIIEFEKNQIVFAEKSKIKYAKNYKAKYDNKQLFLFNPNSLSKDSLLLIGIYPNITERIIKYRNAGGKFKEPSDMMKIYGFNQKLFNKLEPYIHIPFSSENKMNEIKKEIEIVNINSADTNELKSLNGIGSKLSSRIIDFRNKLGGFYSIDQLNEVYGIKPETFENIKSKIQVDDHFSKININLVSADVLQAHPYIKKWNIANAIVNYRNKHGKYSKVEDLLKTDLVNEELCRKIAPYLIFE